VARQWILTSSCFKQSAVCNENNMIKREDEEKDQDRKRGEFKKMKGGGGRGSRMTRFRKCLDVIVSRKVTDDNREDG